MKRYEVQVDITISVTVPVKAESFEEALEIGRDIPPDELYRIKRPAEVVNWDELKVTGVFE